MKQIKLSVYLLLVLLNLLSTSSAFAADRASMIHARIQAALGNVLHKNDYLIVVNRLDELEAVGTEAAVTGLVRPLPGLNAGVDSNGQVVSSDAASKDYNGPIIVSVLIDPAVRKETFELIQKTIPDLAGGLRDLDEYKVARAALRQIPQANPNAPQVTVNNQQQPNQSQNSRSEIWQQAAGLLLIGGILVWFMSRISNQSTRPGSSPREQGSDRQDEQKTESWSDIDFSDLDPKCVALYLLKELNERRVQKLATWAALTSPSEQRRVLQTYPGWVAYFIEKQLSDPELKMKANLEYASSVYREIAVLEQNLIENSDRQRAFLMWFPAPGLRLVTRHQLGSLSEASKLTLLQLRHDLGNLVRVDHVDLLETIKEASPAEIEACWLEVYSWHSKDIVPDRSQSSDIVVTMAGMINRLTEFGPIQQQLEAAQIKLPVADFERLQSIVVSAETPFKWDTDRVKEWLRIVDPQDYQWWLSNQNAPPPWDLESCLRPLRRAMFKAAELTNEPARWTESQKKEAAYRILQQLRYVHLEPESSHVEVESA